MDANTTETPKPRDGEMQPDFAVRFHTSMMDKIPNTEARTQRCFAVWRDAVGDEPEVETARKYHKASEFDERRDIPVFEEHEIPSRKSKDGKRTIPAVKYDRRALAAICRNMNEAVEDIGKFCPITNGHTSDNRSDPEPEVLGYTGAYRLGMVGNTKPRYAIFADEYHRKDRGDLLNGRRGRSVEVLPLPDISKRSFYPIAALGADEPRLNLPPARYFNRPGEHGEDIEVERYMMAAPGGNATFIPGDDRDKYGDDEQELPRNVVQSVMEAFTASAMGQYLIAKMEEEGQAGSPNPLVHQAPPMADMPEDPMDPTGGMPGQQPGMPPGQDAGMPGMDQPGEDPDSDMDDSGIPPESQPGQPSAAGDSAPPLQGKGNMTEPNKDQYSTKSAGFQALEARMTALENENAGLRAKLTGAERYSKLSSLKAQGIEFDLDKELGRVASQTDEQFSGHVENIEQYYRRSPAAVADFSEVHGAGRQGNLPDEAGNGVDGLSQADAGEVVKYARRHNMDYIEARAAYLGEKKSRTATAG